MEKTDRSKRPEVKPMKVPGQQENHAVDVFTKEEQYRLINAELEAKTADLVRQADQVMREQKEVLSRPISTHLVIDTDDEEEDSRIIIPRQPTVQHPDEKGLTKKRVTPRSVSQSKQPGNQRKELHVSYKIVTPMSLGDDVEDLDFSLVKTIQSLTEKLHDPDSHDQVVDESYTGDNIASDAQIRVLKAKLRIMQEELDRLSYDCNKKDDENCKICTKIKEVEEDRAKLQKTTNIQQTQIEKHKALAEESSKKCDGLQLQVAGLQKEIEGLNRAKKQAAGNQSTMEVRLNRALEEVERLKAQLNKTKQTSKDKINEEHQNKENLLAENKMLKKQKAELILGFKKQLKLIDILKRQKMHFEAAKMLSFTEEEFMKALDWGKS
ncbi:testis-expressed protein 9 [Polymixia lowei]